MVSKDDKATAELYKAGKKFKEGGSKEEFKKGIQKSRAVERSSIAERISTDTESSMGASLKIILIIAAVALAGFLVAMFAF